MIDYNYSNIPNWINIPHSNIDIILSIIWRKAYSQRLLLLFDKCYGLLLYFNAVWFTTYPISVWNHYETVGPRTNNHVEGFHSKLNKISGRRPNIYRSINFFKEIETETTIGYNQRILPNGRLPTRRRREDIRRDCDIEFLSQQLKYSP